MYANVLKFHICIPHENIGDPYCFSYLNYQSFWNYFPFNKITLKSRIFVLLLPSWARSVGVKQCKSQAVLQTPALVHSCVKNGL